MLVRLAGLGQKRLSLRVINTSAELSTTIVVTSEGEEVSSLDVREGIHHCLRSATGAGNGQVILDFFTRRAMYDFAVSLLQEAAHGTVGLQYCYPLVCDGKPLVANGARIREDNSRLFAFYGISQNVSWS
jgi:hypothetical protein